ncbi:MAG: thiamine phosphate synthase [Bacteroidales bacterium]|nr:thiamine phosphate synthase [Bacteroidales bacterium]
MLQILIKANENYSLGEMAQMAVEAGAGWIVVSAGEEGREAMTDIATMCREAGIMLSIENDYTTARELGLHGVFVTDNAISPVSLREELGPEAIIGALTGSPDAAASLARADIDYVSLDSAVSDPETFISTLRNAGCEIPVVAYRPGLALDAAIVGGLLSHGFSGICGADRAFDEADPVAALENLLKD